MDTDQGMRKGLDALARTLRPADDIRRAERIERAITNDGKPILGTPDFTRQRSPNGTIWRIKVQDDGSIVTAQEPT